MRINLRKKKKLTDEQLEIISTKDFFDVHLVGIETLTGIQSKNFKVGYGA